MQAVRVEVITARYGISAPRPQPGAASRSRGRPQPRSGSGSGSGSVPVPLPLGYAPSDSATGRRVALRNAPSRHTTSSATATTATMIVEIALISGETPNLIAL